MKIIAVSDLHGYLPRDIPKCDILLIGGDICPHFAKKAGTVGDAQGQADWLDKIFRPWLHDQPADHIIAIWGNHDFVGQYALHPKDLPWILLHESEVTIEGVRIYGTPWTPKFFDWAFMLNDPLLKEKFDAIPEGLDILLSHGPPMWVCDRSYGPGSNHVGSEVLFDRLVNMPKPPSHVVCGHIHGGRGWGRLLEAHCQIWNVSGVDETYYPHNPMWTELVLEDADTL